MKTDSIPSVIYPPSKIAQKVAAPLLSVAVGSTVIMRTITL